MFVLSLSDGYELAKATVRRPPVTLLNVGGDSLGWV